MAGLASTIVAFGQHAGEAGVAFEEGGGVYEWELSGGARGGVAMASSGAIPEHKLLRESHEVVVKVGEVIEEEKESVVPMVLLWLLTG